MALRGEAAGDRAGSAPVVHVANAAVGECVHVLVERVAAARPDAVALDSGSRQLSNGELNAQANRLARMLRSLGVGPGELVGVLAESSIERVVAVLGVLKSGAAYVPLEPDYPIARLRYMVEHSGLRYILTHGDVDSVVVGELSGLVEQVIGIEEAAESQAHSADNPPAQAGPTDLAYVIYTSGSTGTPKGVMIEHAGLANLTAAQNRVFGISSETRELAFAPFSFDASVAETFTALTAGAVLCVPPRSGLRPGEPLLRTLRDQHVSLVTLPPSVLATLDPGQLPDLRVVVSAGEACTSDLVERWAPGRTFLNAYGPTETTVCATVGECRVGGEVTIGSAIDGVELQVLDEQQRQVARGQVGELYIGGRGVARGYLNAPELTEQRFVVPAVDGEVASGRLYRSGDLVRETGEGNLVFLGRADDQVKIRGVRIEIGEIEVALRAHPHVEAAAVTARAFGPLDTRLVAYAVPREQVPAVRALRQHLAGVVPEVYVPSFFRFVEQLPLTPSGKVDRRALPPVTAVRDDVTLKEPADAVEEFVAEQWTSVLGVDRVGTDEDFFELGGNSLLATRLVALIGQALDVEVPLTVMLDNPTVESQARWLRSQLGAGQADDEDPVAAALARGRSYRPSATRGIAHDEARRHDPFPLTDVQQAYAVGRGGAFELGNVSCHVYFEVEAPEIDLPRLQQAWQRVIDRHDMLRAVVIDEQQQRILAEVPSYEISVHDLRESPARVIDAHLEAIRARMSHAVLPASRWPLFDIAATQLPDRTRLHLGFDLLVLDAGSSQTIYEELVTLYQRPDTELSPLGITFRDYVLAEQRHLEDTELERARLYWRQRLETLAPAPELPRATTTASITHPRFRRHTRALDAGLWQRVQTAAAAVGVTPSALLMTVFADVLALWSKQPRFCLNLTLFNRRPLHPDVDRLVGDFTSLSLLEVDRSAPSSFVDRARAIQRQLWTDLEHRAFSGVRVLRELARGPGGYRGAGMPVVFTSTLGLDRGGDSTPWGPLHGLGEIVYGIAQTPQVWLDHQVFEEGGKLVYNWDVVETLFPDGLVDDMLAVYEGHLAHVADHPEAWERELVPSIPDHQQRVRAWVADTGGGEHRGLLHEPFQRQALRTPDRPAVIAGDGTLSYAELEAAANQLAWRLREAGARPNTLVGIGLDKGWRQVVAVLAVLKSGAAYLPIAASQPKDRRAQLVEHGQVEILIHDPADDADWPQDVTFVDVDSAIDPSATVAPSPVQTPDDLAYVIYTSGSTGLPKGVMIEHHAALNTVESVNEQFGVGPSDRAFAISALNFDLSVYDIFGPLAVGGAVVMPAPADGRDPAAWERALERSQVTIWNSVPALFEMLVEHSRGHASSALSYLRLAMLSGDWIPVTLPERAWGLNQALTMVSLGGATEASIWSIFHEIESVDSTWVSIPYGEALENQHMYVLDHRLRVRPDWAVGDLYIGGVGVARGYWDDPERTAERFLTHPETGERLYRTGDLGSYMPDGAIEFLGRDDFQVKVQGHRIELGEIETTLSRHESVESCVAAAPGEPGHRRLIAYVVPAKGRQPSAEELRAFLQGTLPAYMVPGQIHVVDSLPLTANGKIDRTSVPAPTQTAAVSASESRPGRGPEQLLVRLFADLLGVDHVGVDDDFFDLGGDSILAIQLVSRANAAGVPLTATHVFEHPTVGALAAALGASTTVVGDEEAPQRGVVPFTPEQRVYLEWALPHTDLSFEVHELEANQAIVPEALRAAFARVMAHHEALGARYDLRTPGADRQVFVDPGSDVPFEVFDLADVPDDEFAAELQGASAELQSWIDVERGPIVDLGLVRGGSRPDVVLMVAAHIAVDAFSWRVLFEDLQQAYLQLLDGTAVQLPPRTTSFKVWCERLAALANEPSIRADKAFWLDESVYTAPMPRDLPGGQNSEESARWVFAALEPDESERILRDVPRATGTRIDEVLLAPLVRTLGRWAGSDSVLVGQQRHGRDTLGVDVDVSRTVGRFSHTFPVAFTGALELEPRHALKLVADRVRQVPHRGASFGLLRSLADDEELTRRWSADALPEVGFNYVGQFDQVLRFSSLFRALRWGQVAVLPRGRRRFVLEVHGAVRGGQLEFGWRYSQNIHHQATVQALSEVHLDQLRALSP
jgi:amino acid adenylation domain-containing protein/non-ribosomal peptide synthase protein (TIGR01720 family)